MNLKKLPQAQKLWRVWKTYVRSLAPTEFEELASNFQNGDNLVAGVAALVAVAMVLIVFTFLKAILGVFFPFLVLAFVVAACVQVYIWLTK